MDFTPSEAADELGRLTRDIASAISTTDRVAELENADAPIDEKLWRELGAAGLLGLAARPESGGQGLGSEETVAVAVELGRALARIPFAVHAVAAIPALDRYGAPALVGDLLEGATTGDVVLSAAVEEEFGGRVPAATTVLSDDGTLSGTKVNVAYAQAASALLVTAGGPDGPVVVVVRTDAPGVTITATPSTGLTPVATVEFAEVPTAGDDVLRGGGQTVAELTDLLRLGVCADQTGVVAGALDATAEYAREREQFGRPIGSFQAVAQRLADGYIDAQGLALTTAQAAWLMSGAADCTPAEIRAAVAGAKFWADEAGHRVAHTAVHVHGGVGLDTSHPAHRYFLRSKQNEFTLGTAPVVLTELGELIAAGAIE